MPPLPSSRRKRYGPIWEPTRDSRSGSLIWVLLGVCLPANTPYAGLRLARGDLERELVIADADPVAVGQRRRAPYAFVPHVDSIGRAQIGDHETRAGVDDDGVVAA